MITYIYQNSTYETQQISACVIKVRTYALVEFDNDPLPAGVTQLHSRRRPKAAPLAQLSNTGLGRFMVKYHNAICSPYCITRIIKVQYIPWNRCTFIYSALLNLAFSVVLIKLSIHIIYGCITSNGAVMRLPQSLQKMGKLGRYLLAGNTNKDCLTNTRAVTKISTLWSLLKCHT